MAATPATKAVNAQDGHFLISRTSDGPSTIPKDLTYQNFVMGIALGYPAGYKILEDQYLRSEFGFIIVDNDSNPVLDVSWLHKENPGNEGALINTIIRESLGVSISQSTQRIGQLSGKMISPVPGVVESTVIFLVANGRVYSLRYYQAALDQLGHSIIASVRFFPPTKSLDSLQLLHTDDVTHIPPEVEKFLLQTETFSDVQERQLKSRGKPDPDDKNSQEIKPLATAPGCKGTSRKVRTQWDQNANDSGYSWAGPSFYGQGTHLDCDSTSKYNDYYALDFALDEWDLIYAPAKGKVIMAGWATAGWCTLGRTVIIDHGGGFWTVSAHLRSISPNITVGTTVYPSTLIGYAGGSGCEQDNYHGIHLHASMNYQAKIQKINGVPVGIYAGKSVRPRGYTYSRGRGGIYYSSRLTSGQEMSY